MSLRRKALCIAAVLCTLLAGCATETVPAASDPHLAVGDGLMAVGFDKGDSPIHWALLTVTHGHGSVRVTNVAKGLSMYLYEVKAGRYCLDEYSAGSSTFRAKSGDGVLCATVRAGHLTYFGHLSPAQKVSSVSFSDGRVQMKYAGDIFQTYQFELFYEELKQDYPAIFDRYAAEIEAPELRKIEYIEPAAGGQ
jgi:hypothetical protein